MLTSPSAIALMRPRLPASAAILPYLEQIDANRWYSNFGPLVETFCERLAEAFHKPAPSVAVMSNGTSALTAIFQALALPRGSVCLLPSWTFAASPASILAAGLIPHFMDVEEHSWSLSPSRVREILRSSAAPIRAVMAVAPFGAPLDIPAWDALSDETGVAVVIDAAAGFDAFSTGRLPKKSPVMISLHATKALGIGEGAMIIADNLPLIEKIKRISNFGFGDSRMIVMAGINAKMSEYHAAVGLAALDEWPQVRSAWHRLKHLYAHGLENARLPLTLQPLSHRAWIGSTLNLTCQDMDADMIIQGLKRSGVESRKWWSGGCHAHPAYSGYPRESMTVTEGLGKMTFAVPFTLDMGAQEVSRVVEALTSVLAAERAPAVYASHAH